MTDAIIEAAERALEEWDSYLYPGMARAVLTAVTPLIRAAALEEAAKAVEAMLTQPWVRDQVVAAIRSLKAQP